MSRFTDYQTAAGTGVVRLDWRHELISPNREILATTDPDSGAAIHWGARLRPLAHETARFSARTATLSVEGTHPDLIPDKPGSLLHPATRNRVVVSAGLVGVSSTTWYTQATMLISAASAVRDGPVTVTVGLVDVLRCTDSELASGFAFIDGEPVESVVARLLARVYPSASDYSVTPTGFTVPAGSFETGENIRDLIEELLGGCGHELTADRSGIVFTRPVPPTTADDLGEVWLYGPGGIAVETARRGWVDHPPQGFVVEYGSFADGENGDSVVVFDSDPSSEGFFDSEQEAILEPVKFPLARTNVQASAAGHGILRRESPGPAQVEFFTIPNPAIEPNDQIDLTEPDLNASGLYRVIGYDLPLQVDGQMKVLARAVFNPELSFEAPIERGSGWQTAFSDDFDRADENLEDLPVGGGSPNWTEIGWSWYVMGNAAIQRYNRNWSFGIVNTALQSTDHSATIVISVIPTERFLGPVVRSSGGADGYVAVADDSGKVSLEWWQNRTRAAVLATHDSGGSVEGKTLTVKAVGRTISAELDTVEVMSVSDDRGGGAFVGMAAYGGWTGNSPAVASFSAAAAS
jgi:hypothetical protein